MSQQAFCIEEYRSDGETYGFTKVLAVFKDENLANSVCGVLWNLASTNYDFRVVPYSCYTDDDPVGIAKTLLTAFQMERSGL